MIWRVLALLGGKRNDEKMLMVKCKGRPIPARQGKQKGKMKQVHLESAVQRGVVCCVREGWVASKKRSLLILHFNEWDTNKNSVGAIIHFTGEVSGSSPGWPSCAEGNQDKKSIWSNHVCILYLTCSEHRGYSSVGRAPPLQAGRCAYGLGA